MGPRKRSKPNPKAEADPPAVLQPQTSEQEGQKTSKPDLPIEHKASDGPPAKNAVSEDKQGEADNPNTVPETATDIVSAPNQRRSIP